MDKQSAIMDLMDRIFTAVETPIAHSFGYAELIQHELQNDDADLAQVDDDLDRIKVNLDRVLLYLQDFAEEYENLKS